MPSDIRSFFAPKGGAPPKPAAKKAEEPAKTKRTSRSQDSLSFSIILTKK